MKNNEYRSNLSCIGEPTAEDLKKTFNNHVPVSIMSHRNLGLFLSEENGENKITAEALDESSSINAEGLDKALYDID